jgi:DNA (cytosine-5)-methyltransferase 1
MEDTMKDLIIDCFACGGGASVGLEMGLGRHVNYAINHNPIAIAMHMKNHPDTIHLTEDIFKVDMRKHLKWGQRVKVLWASPDCTSHSKAKGGQPRESGLRILPWAVHKICKQILEATGRLPEVIFMENVEEIQDWGPLDDNGHPIKKRKGEDYRKFIKAMKNLGYEFECRELIAADYGAPTTRKRWYGIFRCDSKPIVWPIPTHSKSGTDGLKKWEPIYPCLDFSDLGKSIFGRKTPLKENTMNRIARGIQKFIIDNPDPYFIPDDIAYPFLIQYHGETCGNVRGQALTEPIRTIDTSNRYGLVTAFLTKFYKTGTGQTVTEPIHTITTSPGHFGLISAFLIKYYGCGTGQDINMPIDTITTKDRFGLVTVVIKGETYQIVDIYLRMVKPEELKLGQGFPKDYIIDFNYKGKKYPVSNQTANIGNSVVPIMAKVIAEANCSYLKVGERMPNAHIDDSQQQLRFA